MKEKERRKKEERARKEQQARKRGEIKGRQVKQDKRNAGMTEKKSATRRAVEEKHLSKC